MVSPQVYVKAIEFSGGDSIALDPDDIIVIVGPNNSGKSATLRSIEGSIKTGRNSAPTTKTISLDYRGSLADFTRWVPRVTTRTGNTFRVPNAAGSSGTLFPIKDLSKAWNDKILGALAPLLCRSLAAGDRLNAIKPIKRIAVTGQPFAPLQHLLVNEQLESRMSQLFQEAFGSELIVNHGAGENIVLHVGSRPVAANGRDRVSREYIAELEKLPTIHNDGDGVRSFAAVLLNLLTSSATLLLVDEPEAFLHPPQARLIGRMLARERKQDCQLFIATHSGDVLRGLLDSNSPKLRIVRLRRRGNVNEAHELRPDEIRQYWNDSLLRYSNILDGIFHDKVVICESDSDNRFYAAVLDAILKQKGSAERRPDFMFAHCGGKARLPSALKALQRLRVPVAAIADFDALNDEQPLRGIAEALGVNWDQIKDNWRKVKTAVEEKKPELGTREIREKITDILKAVTEPILPRSARASIESELRRSTPWSIAKTAGRAYIPNGDPTKALNALLDVIEAAGLFITPVGELEGWVKDVGGHGPGWVNAVLEEKDFSSKDLEPARDFISKVTTPL